MNRLAAIATLCVLAASVLSGCSLSGAPADADAPPAAAACGQLTAATIAQVDETTAARIYADELSGAETRRDVAQVQGDAALLAALAAHDNFAATAATIGIVYSGTHIVRLRIERAGSVVADIGGPYVAAPVAGWLRYRGRVVGSFELSVQDDLGLQKLIYRYAGADSAMLLNGRQVMGTAWPPIASLRPGAELTVGHRQLYALEFDAAAFPSGVLRVWVLAPTRLTPVLAQLKCADVTTAALGHIAARIVQRFRPLTPKRLQLFAWSTHAVTHTTIVVRNGPRTLAASSPAPAHLPLQGVFAGQRISSFTPPGAPRGTRVWVLAPLT